MKEWKLLKLSFSVLAATLLCSAMAMAEFPIVKTVPWVAANPLIPHDTWSGKEITLKGTTNVSGSDFEYWWDYGDGGSSATADVGSNNYILEAFHTYTGDVDDIFTARLYVRHKSTGDTASKPYLVQIRAQSLGVEVNVAIDEGLWYLQRSQTRASSGGIDYGYWFSTSTNYTGATATAVNAFEARGHTASLVGDDNPYKETVTRGLNRVFQQLTVQRTPVTYRVDSDFLVEDYNFDGVVSVGEGNNATIQMAGNYHYQQGMLVDAIVASGTPAAVVPDNAFFPAFLRNRTYQSVVQDLVDEIVYGQYSHETATNRGGWTYWWGNYGDNSICQWAAIGLIPAVRNGWAQIPAWVTQLNPTWLLYSQHAVGYFGYQSSSPIWGPYAVTPSGMVQMVMDGIGRGDEGTPAAGMPSWDKAEKYLYNSFVSTNTGYSNQIKDYYYGLFSFVKAMRLHNPPIEMFRDYSESHSSGIYQLDWYHAEISNGDPTDGVARSLVDDQDKTGSSTHGRWWPWSYPTSEHRYLSTAWAVLMLSPTLFEAGSPVAEAQAYPNPGVAFQTIQFDGSASFHQDSSKNIIMWEWDFDNDGTYDATGPFATHSFPAVDDYPVVLRVTDDSSPVKTDTDTIVVKITTPPIAPTADAGGPYAFCPQAQPWFLDGTGSVNPDDGKSEPGAPGDYIQAYAWDLDGDGAFDDASGSQPDVSAYFTAMGVGSYLIQLQVTDNTAASFPSSGLGDLSDSAAAQVFVKDALDEACQCIDNLAARAKLGKVQLTWTAASQPAGGFNVYRSTVSGGPYMFIANTASTYSTYLDTDVVVNTTYFYVVRPAALNGNELCQSNQASIKVPATRTR